VSPAPPQGNPPGPREVLLTEEDLRIFARLLLHIARQPRFAPLELVPPSLTQAGMAAALGTTQAAVSNALGRLVDGGALRVERGHVQGKFQRLKVYQLTDQGEALVRHIRSSMELFGKGRSRAGPGD
jgi:DNA-binding MarR family transcriptional regulator